MNMRIDPDFVPDLKIVKDSAERIHGFTVPAKVVGWLAQQVVDKNIDLGDKRLKAVTVRLTDPRVQNWCAPHVKGCGWFNSDLTIAHAKAIVAQCGICEMPEKINLTGFEAFIK